jgi:hypothetical protein
MIMTWTFVWWLALLMLQWSIALCFVIGRLLTRLTRRGDPGILKDLVASAVAASASLALYCVLAFRVPPTGALSLMNPWIGVLGMASVLFLCYRFILLLTAVRRQR